ncbi:MAG: fibronectin type III domain-containing protein [Patescibacteria group bacterium]
MRGEGLKNNKAIVFVVVTITTLILSLVVILGFLRKDSSAAGNACVWVGGTNTNWETAANWSSCNSTYPDSSDSIVFSQAATYGLTMTANKTVTAVSAPSTFNSTFNTNGYSLTVNGDVSWLVGTLNASASEITITGNLDLSGASSTFTYGTSSVIMTGAGTTLKPKASNATSFYDLTIQTPNNTDAVTIDTNDFNVRHKLGVNRGKLDGASRTVTMTSTPTYYIGANSGGGSAIIKMAETGSIVAGGGIANANINIDGTGKTVGWSGTATLTNLSAINGTLTIGSGKLVFPASEDGSAGKLLCTASTSTLNFSGTNVGQMVILRSASPGTHWYFNNGCGTSAGTYMDVAWGLASSGTITGTNSYDSGNNSGFSPSGLTVIKWVGGVSSDWSDANNWSPTTRVPNATTDIAYFDSTSVVDVNLTATTTVGSVLNPDYTGTLSTQNFNLTIANNITWDDGEISAGSSTITVTGNSSTDLSGSTYTKGTSRFKLTTTNCCSSGNFLPPKTGDFYDLEFASPGRSYVSMLDVSNDLYLTSGELGSRDKGGTINLSGDIIIGTSGTSGSAFVNFVGSGTQTISSVGGGTNLTSIIVNKPSGALVLDTNIRPTVYSDDGGDWLFRKADSFTHNNHKISIAPGWPSYFIGGALNNGSSVHYYDVEQISSPRPLEIVGNVYVDNLLNLDAPNYASGQFNSGTVYLAGNLTVGATFGGGTASIIMTGTGKTITETTGGVAPVIAVNTSGTISLASNVTVAGVNQVAGYTGTLDTQNFNLTTPGSFLWKSGIFNAGSSTITITGRVTADFTGGTFNCDTSTLVLGAIGSPYLPALVWLTGTTTFNNVTLYGISGYSSLSITGTPTVTGTLNFAAGDVAFYSNGGTIILLGDLTSSDTSSTGQNGGTTVIDWQQTEDISWNPNLGKYPQLKFNSSRTVTLTGNLTSSGFQLSAGTFDAGANTITIGFDYVRSSLTYNTYNADFSGGIFNCGTSTVVLIPLATMQWVTGSNTFYNVSFSSGVGYPILNITGNPTVGGTLSFNSIDPNYIVNGGTIFLTGDLATSNKGLKSGTTALTLTGVGVQTVTASAISNLAGTTLTIAKPSGKAVFTTAAGTGTINNNIALTSGSLEFSGGSTGGNTFTMTVGKTLTASAGTNLYFNGTSGNLVTFDSSDHATAIAMTKPDGVVVADYAAKSRMAVSGGATWYSTINSTPSPDPNTTGNTGWTASGSGNVRTVSAAGGNWDTAGAWNEGVVPTASDAVFALPSSGNATVNVASVAKSLDCTGYTNTLTHNAVTLTVSGSVTLASGKYTTSGAAVLAMNANGTLVSAGNTLYQLTTSVGTITLGDASNVSNAVTLTSGTLITDGGAGSLTHNWIGINATGVVARTLTLGNSTINMSSTINGLSIANTTSLTLNANTSTINLTGASVNPIVATTGGSGVTFNTVNITGSGTPILNAPGSTFGTLSRTGTAVKTDGFTISANITVTGTFVATGNSATDRVLVQSGTLGTPQTITVTGATVSVNNADFQDITFARTTAGGLDLTNGGANLVGDCGGNSRTGGDETVTFTTAEAQSWNDATGGSWSDVTNWSGESGNNRVPLPQDNVWMGGLSGAGFVYNSGVTVTADMPRLGKSIVWTGATDLGTDPRWTMLSSSNTSYGNLTLISGMSLTNSSGTYNLAGRTASYTITSATKQFNWFYITAPTGTYTLTDALTVTNTVGVTAGSFVSAGYSITTPYYFKSLGTITRSVDISNSLITITNGNYGWRVEDTGLSLTATGSTISFIYAGGGTLSFIGGTKTYNNILIAPGTAVLTFSGAFTFANMTMASAGTRTVKFTSGTTYTMTGSNFLNGTSGNLVTIDSSDGSTQFTLTKASGMVIADYVSVSHSNVTGGAKWFVTSNSTPYPDPNINGNTGWLTDPTPPTNPTVSAVTVGGNAVTASTWINYSGATNITFSGAADPDSGLVGYYIYFGTNASVDPSTYQAHVGAEADAQTYSTSISSADDGKHFYFRLETKDAIGNIGTAVTLFDFGYDITLPTRPTFVASDPAGYTTTNSYTLSWPAGTDPNGVGGGASGIKYYEYKRATDASWSQTDDDITRSVLAVEAYQEGVNIFYVRTVDNANNTSSTYQQVTYYYSGVAPAKPTNLVVNPSTSDSNSFTISWDKSSIGAGDPPVVGYYYSINAAPTISNVTYVASQADHVSIGPDAYATIQGVNTVYVLGVNSAGNLSYESAYVASTTFSCQTPAPPAPTSVSLTDSSNRAYLTWSLTLKWSAGLGQDPSVFDHYIIYRSTDGGVSYSFLSTTAGTAYVDASGLNNSTEYYYNIKAVDNAGKESAQSSVVHKIPTGKFLTPPNYLSIPTVSEIKSNSAKVSWTTDRASSSIVRYGTSVSNLSASTGDLTASVLHSVTLAGLDPSTLYYFQSQSLDEDRDYSADSAYSTIYTFSTGAAPAISETKVSNITLTTIDISFATTTVATSTISYGKTNSYGTNIEDISGAQATNHAVKIINLTPGTTYHFKIFGNDIDGNSLTSDDYQFDTLPLPEINNFNIETIVGSPRPAFRAQWVTNVPTSTILHYSTGGANKEIVKAKLETSHTVEVTELMDNLTYIITVSGRDSLGNLTESSPKSFITPLDSRPPKISDIAIESSFFGSENGKSQISVAWKTDEPTSGKVDYGINVEGPYSGSVPGDQNLALEHSVVISGLEPAVIHHLKIIATDNGGNKTESESQIFVTAEAKEGVWGLIMRALESIFGFIKITE